MMVANSAGEHFIFKVVFKRSWSKCVKRLERGNVQPRKGTVCWGRREGPAWDKSWQMGPQTELGGEKEECADAGRFRDRPWLYPSQEAQNYYKLECGGGAGAGNLGRKKVP